MESVELLSGANVALVSLVLMLTAALKLIFSEAFATTLGQRLLPVVPIVLGVIGAFAGISETGSTWQEKLVSGLMSGISAAAAYKLGKTTVMGQGITEKAKE